MSHLWFRKSDRQYSSIAQARWHALQTAATNPKKIILEPGKYKIELNPVKPAGLARRSKTIEVLAKKTVDRTLIW